MRIKNIAVFALSAMIALLAPWATCVRADDAVEGSQKDSQKEAAASFALPARGALPETRAAGPAASKMAQQLPVSAGTKIEPLPPAAAPVKSQAAIETARLLVRAKSGVVSERKLANGLKVLFVEAPEYPVVSTLMWYRVGSADEEPGKTGLSHLLEHLLFGSVGSFKPGEIGSAIARYGGKFNGYTSDDFITFFETLPSNKLELGLKIESDRMRGGKFTEDDVIAELKNIRAEFDRESQDAAALVSREVRAMLFMQHPYHNPTMGWRTDLDNLHADDVKRFYDRHFWPDNATLVIAGDIDPRTATTLVDKYFAAIPRAPQRNVRPPVNESTRSERRVSLKYPGKSEVLQVAWRAPAFDDGDAAAVAVLERVLNGGLSGRLKSRLVDTKLSTGSQAAYEIKREPGLFSVTTTAQPGTWQAQQKLLEAVDAVVAQLKEKPVADAELKRAKNHAEFSFQSESNGPYRAGFHIGYFDSLGKWQGAKAWAERLRAVTAADVQRVSKKYLQSDDRVIGWIAGSAAVKATPPKPVEPARDALEKNPRPLAYLPMAGFKESDSAKGPAFDTPKEKRKGIPAIIDKVPSALGNAVTGNLTGAVENVGSAILNVPNALGDISQAVATTAGVLGKQISQLIPGGDNSSARVSRRVLKNGINLLVFESHLTPVVQINGSLEAGDAYNPPGKTGVAAVVAGVLNQGSSRRGKAQMQSAQDDLGIPQSSMLSFSNQLESIDFQTGCLAKDLAIQLDVISETLSAPALDETSLEKARQESLSAVKRSSENLATRIDRVMMQSLLSPNSPFCPPDPVEKSKSITAVTKEDVQKFLTSHVVPGSSTIVICGDIEPDQAAALVEKSFARWQGKSEHSRLHAHAAANRVVRSSLPVADAKKSQLCFGRLVPLSESHQDYGSLLIADGILVNHPMVSRFEQAVLQSPALEKSLAEKPPLADLVPYSNQVVWKYSFEVEPSVVPQAVKTVKTELRQLAKNGISAEEFNEARRYLVGSIAVREQSTLQAVAENICEAAEHGEVADCYNTRLSSIRAASIDSVNRVVRSAFKPELATLVVAGPASSIKSARTGSSQQED